MGHAEPCAPLLLPWGGRRSPSALLWVRTPSLCQRRLCLSGCGWSKRSISHACPHGDDTFIKGNFGPLLTVPACSAPACCRAAPPRAAAHQRCQRAPAVTLPCFNTKKKTKKTLCFIGRDAAPGTPLAHCRAQGTLVKVPLSACDTGPAPCVWELLLLSAFSPLAPGAAPPCRVGALLLPLWQSGQYKL